MAILHTDLWGFISAFLHQWMSRVDLGFFWNWNRLVFPVVDDVRFRWQNRTHGLPHRWRSLLSWFWMIFFSWWDLVESCKYESLNPCWHFVIVFVGLFLLRRRRWESTESRLAGALFESFAGEHWGKRLGPNKAYQTTKPCLIVWVVLTHWANVHLLCFHMKWNNE